MMRRKLLVMLKGFDSVEERIDYDLWLKLAQLTDFSFIDAVLTEFRV